MCISERAFPCVYMWQGGLYINGFHTLAALVVLAGGERQAKAFENERQSDAGGGDWVRRHLDSPVVYL